MTQARNRTIGIALGLAAVLGAAAYIGSPYLAAQKLSGDIKTGNRDGLAKDIDFPSVRDNLKSELNAQVAKSLGSDPSMKDNPFAGLGAMIVPVIIDKAMDAYVTPDAFAMLAKSNNSNASTGSTGSPSPFATIGKGEVKTRYSGINSFEILAPTDKGDLDMHMERQGLFGWRVERISLPDGLFNPANNTSTTTTTTTTTTNTTDSAPTPAPASNTTAETENSDASSPNGVNYIFDVPSKMPVAFAKWQAEVPMSLRQTDYIYKLDGTAGPPRAVVADGKPMIFGTICMPHNCGGNELSVLVATDQSEIVGMSISDDSTTPVIIGDPTDAQTACLKRFKDEDSLVTC